MYDLLSNNTTTSRSIVEFILSTSVEPRIKLAATDTEELCIVIEPTDVQRVSAAASALFLLDLRVRDELQIRLPKIKKNAIYRKTRKTFEKKFTRTT